MIIVETEEVQRVDAEGGICAGIPWSWIIDTSGQVSLVACYRGEEHQWVTGTFTTQEPFPFTIDLDRLR